MFKNEQINVAVAIIMMVLTFAYVLYAFTACVEVSQSLGYLSMGLPVVKPFVKVAPKPLGEDTITVVNHLINQFRSDDGAWITPNEIERVVLDECDPDDHRAACHFARLFDGEIPPAFTDMDVVGFVDDVPELDALGMRVVNGDWFDQE